MSDEKSIDDLMKQLNTLAGELEVQLHLGAAEAKEEFAEAKDKLEQLKLDYEPTRKAVEESADNVMSSIELLGEELLTSFKRIRDSLK